MQNKSSNEDWRIATSTFVHLHRLMTGNHSLVYLYMYRLNCPFILFLLFPCFTRPYITFLRCSDVKPLSLTTFIFKVIISYYYSIGTHS